jgi:hypothetical protein
MVKLGIEVPVPAEYDKGGKPQMLKLENLKHRAALLAIPAAALVLAAGTAGTAAYAATTPTPTPAASSAAEPAEPASASEPAEAPGAPAVGHADAAGTVDYQIDGEQ